MKNGENAGYQHFRIFPQCFKAAFFPRVVKSGSAIIHEIYALLPIAINVCYWYYQLQMRVTALKYRNATGNS